MTRTSRTGYLRVMLGCAPLLSGCAASGEDPRFDALDCLELRAESAAPNARTVLVNRCDRPIAMLVVMCDLALQPACRVDPIFSRGWSAHRGIEHVASGRTRTGLPGALLKAGTRVPGQPPYAPGIPKGWRAQIAACRLNHESAVSHDRCAVRLAELKRVLDASGGKSMRAVLGEVHSRGAP